MMVSPKFSSPYNIFLSLFTSHFGLSSVLFNRFGSIVKFSGTCFSSKFLANTNMYMYTKNMSYACN